MKTITKPNQNQKPVLTGEEADPIALKQAAEWTRNYRERYPNEVISYFFGINIIKEIIHQEGCIGLRIYYANSKPLSSFQKFVLSISNFLRTIVSAEGEKHLIVVGSDKFGNDQLPGDSNSLGNDESDRQTEKEETSKKMMYSSESSLKQYIIAEQASPCPGPGCPKNQLSVS